MKKCLFIVLALFGLNAFADTDMHTGMDHMSDMISSSGEGDSGFMGSFSLRYKPMGFDETAEDLTYRARIGWSGDLNEAVQWTLGLSTDTEQSFGTLGLSAINLEQAYITYSPMEGVSIRVGKSGWMPDFHKVGVLYSEQIYYEGVSLKYKQSMDDENNWYAKVALYKLDEGQNMPLADGATLKGKLGGSYGLSEDMMFGLHVSGLYDGLMKEEGHEANTLAQLGVHFSTFSMPVPVGVFAVYLTDAAGITAFNSYAAGISVGQAGKATSTEMGDFGLAASYYDIKDTDFTVNWLNEDYVSGAGKGVAVRAQYNPWDNTSLVAKYAHDMGGGDDTSNLVAELMFVF